MIGIATYYMQKQIFTDSFLVSASEGKSKRNVYDNALSVGLGSLFRTSFAVYPEVHSAESK